MRTQDRWFGSLAFGLIAFLAVFGVLDLAQRLGSGSTALTYAVMIAATCILCVIPRVARGGVLVLFLSVLIWTVASIATHPADRVEFRSLDLYLRFARLGSAMLGATIASLVARRTLRGPHRRSVS